MRTLFKLCLLFAILAMMLSLGGGLAIWHWASDLPGVSVSVNGEDLDLAGLGSPGHWLGAVIGLGVAALALCLVVPLLLLFSIGLPLLIVGAVFVALLAGVMGIGAVVCSPFVLFVLLLVWLLRKKPHRGSRRNSPNIAA